LIPPVAPGRAGRLSMALGIALAFGAAAMPAPARAQHKRAETAEERAAREHYDKGIRKYDLGEFDEAIAEFKQAYSIVPTPGLLFNIAQAFRLKKDYEQALYFYRRYLRVAPSPPNRKDVEARIAEIERLRSEKERPPHQPPRDAIPPDDAGAAGTSPTAGAMPAAAPPDRVARRSGRVLKWSGLVTAATGVAAVGAGVYFGLQARSASDDLAALAAQHGAWSDHYQKILSDGQSEALRANVLFAAGGALVVAGGVLYYLGWRRDAEPAAVAVTWSSGGPTLAVWGRF
jgi:tetratricopeptide (TPR) repeat protein